MKIIRKITNGVILVLIGLMHTQFCLSSDGFGKQFHVFSKAYFFNLGIGADDFPLPADYPHFDLIAAFWFFYFGILLIPLGLLIHSIEKDKKVLSHGFTISYLVVVIIGVCMVPKSGMTYFMLPHGIYMLVSNFIKARKAALKL